MTASADIRFTTCLSILLQWEGGYADHPADPGGATNMGITRATLAGWRGIVPYTKLPKSEVKNLTRAEAAQIYRAWYWNKVRGDDLPAGVDLVVFDYAVHSGPVRAVKALQKVLGATQDGIVGPITLGALAKADPYKVVEAVCDQRMAYLKGLSTFGTFGKGWTNRVTDIRTRARTLVDPGAARPAAPEPEPEPKSGGGFWSALIRLVLNLLGVRNA